MEKKLLDILLRKDWVGTVANITMIITIVGFFWLIGYFASTLLIVQSLPTVLGWVLIGAASLTLPLTYYLDKKNDTSNGKPIGLIAILIGQMIYGAIGVFSTALFSVYFIQVMTLNALLSRGIKHDLRSKWVTGFHILLFLASIANLWFLSPTVGTALALVQVGFMALDIAGVKAFKS